MSIIYKDGNWYGQGGGGGAVPSGGLTGQALVKQSDADQDAVWRYTEKIQYDEMPAADQGNLGQIVQYIGETTSEAPIYTNGLYYECVYENDIYSWKLKDVQTYPEVNLTKVFASGFPSPMVSADGVPVCTIISYFGLAAPAGYLICDGAEYNREYYPALAAQLIAQFPDLAGDGETTFNVPDLRGEFLRGTGTNSHANQGSGADVGVHQDGTTVTDPFTNEGKNICVPYNGWTQGGSDSKVKMGVGYVNTQNVIRTATTNYPALKTVRPTNTSVLYCIKY